MNIDMPPSPTCSLNPVVGGDSKEIEKKADVSASTESVEAKEKDASRQLHGEKRALEEDHEKDAKKAKHSELIVPRYAPNHTRQAVTVFSADWKKALEKVAMDPSKDRYILAMYWPQPHTDTHIYSLSHI
jgi:hypothetical protein